MANVIAFPRPRPDRVDLAHQVEVLADDAHRHALTRETLAALRYEIERLARNLQQRTAPHG